MKRTCLFRRSRCFRRVLSITAGLAMILLGGHAVLGQTPPRDVPGLYLWYQADAIAGVQNGDVVTQWNDSGPRQVNLDQRLGNPRFVSQTINRLPAVRFPEGQTDGLRTSATMDELAGDPSVTIFLVAQIARGSARHEQPLGWGNGGARAGAALFLEFEAGRLDLGTGFSADATTPDGAYAACFDQPTIIMAAKSAGPIGRTTRITLNGTAAAVTGSSLVPNVMVTPFNVGGDPRIGYVSPAMDVAEIMIYSRLLSLDEQNRVGYYLQTKYGIDARFVKPEEFVVVDLEVRAEPPDVAAAVGFMGKQQQVQGTTVELVAPGNVVVRSDAGPRAFWFERWQGEVAQPTSCKTTVHINRAKTITAVYRERNVILYVAPNGRDDWSGTLAEPNAAGTDGPFATPARARDEVRKLKANSAGSTPVPVKVLLRAGKYFLTEPLVLGPEDSGTSMLPVTYAAYPNEKPVLSGGRRITSWQPHQDQIWQSSIAGAPGGAWNFRQLFYNGQCQIRARIPDFQPQNPLQGGWANLEGPAQPDSQIAFRYKPDTFPRRWAKPHQAEVNLFIGEDWANNIIPIQSLDEPNRVLTLAHSTTRFTQPPLPFNYPTPFRPNQRFRVENVLEELDQPGEWCWDVEEGKLYFWPPDDGLAKAEVIVPVLDGLIVLRGASQIVISGLTLTETNGGDNFHPDGVEGVGAMFPMPGWKYCGDAVLLDGAESCRIEDARLVNVGGNAVYLKGAALRNLIRRNEISYVGACGVCLAGAEAGEQYPVFNEVVENQIHHTGRMNMYSAGVFLGLSEGNVIGHNSIQHVPHHAINLGNTGRSHNIVEYNEIRDTCLETSDTGAINCWMEHDPRHGPRQGHIIRYNLIVDSRERGIYLDNYTSNCCVYGNVVVRTASWGLIVHGGKNNVIENNVFVDTLQAVAYYDGIDGLMPPMALFSSGNRFCRNVIYGAQGVVFLAHKRPQRVLAQSDYNLLFRAGDAQAYLASQQDAGYELHSRIADPLFIDPQRDDYRLQPDSPAFQLGFQPLDFSQIGTPRPTN